MRSVGPYSSTTAATALDSAGWSPSTNNVRVAGQPDHAGQMPPGTGSHDGDPRGVDVEGVGIGPYVADGAFGVDQLGRPAKGGGEPVADGDEDPPSVESCSLDVGLDGSRAGGRSCRSPSPHRGCTRLSAHGR